MSDYFNVISVDPPIIVRSLLLRDYLLENLPDKPVTHWVFIPFYLSNHQTIIEDRKKFHDARPGDDLYYFINEEESIYKLRGKDLNLVSSPLEAMADLNYFKIDRTITKRRNALMVARSTSVKRIELAASIESLLIITRLSNPRHQEYHEKMIELFGKRIIDKHFDKDQINRFYNESRVGLCLSGHEGAQRTIMEHQLAGNPVLSTTSKGGRSRWVNPETCLIVPPDPNMIRNSLQDLIKMDHDPQFVRHLIVQKISRYRNDIINLGESILNNHGQFGFDSRIVPIVAEHQGLTPWCHDLDQMLSKLGEK